MAWASTVCAQLAGCTIKSSQHPADTHGAEVVSKSAVSAPHKTRKTTVVATAHSGDTRKDDLQSVADRAARCAAKRRSKDNQRNLAESIAKCIALWCSTSPDGCHGLVVEAGAGGVLLVGAPASGEHDGTTIPAGAATAERSREASVDFDSETGGHHAMQMGNIEASRGFEGDALSPSAARVGSSSDASGAGSRLPPQDVSGGESLPSPAGAHALSALDDWRVTMVPSAFDEESFALYKRYQVAVHGDKEIDITRK